MSRRRTWVASSTMLLAILASEAANPHEGAMGITAERMKVMKDMAGHMRALGEMLGGLEPYDAARAGDLALELHENCHTAAAQYPASGHDHHSRAAPAVWEQPERFESEMDTLTVAVSQLVAATASGQRETIAARFGEVGRACSSCHETFRLPEE